MAGDDDEVRKKLAELNAKVAKAQATKEFMQKVFGLLKDGGFRALPRNVVFEIARMACEDYDDAAFADWLIARWKVLNAD